MNELALQVMAILHAADQLGADSSQFGDAMGEIAEIVEKSTVS
jgi:hypothetical protein